MAHRHDGSQRRWRSAVLGSRASAHARIRSEARDSGPNVLSAEFIESAVLRQGSPFVTRGAPGVGTNLGGAIEVVVPEGGIWLRGFSWFGEKGAP